MFLIASHLLAGPLHAEGAVRIFDCAIVKSCDGAGECKSASAKVNFRLEPVALKADGSGQYTLRYDGNDSPMQMLSATGPFVWTIREERNTLLLSSETEMVWHQLLLGSSAKASIRFLVCKVKQ